jgi:hypothetical protein
MLPVSFVASFRAELSVEGLLEHAAIPIARPATNIARVIIKIS